MNQSNLTITGRREPADAFQQLAVVGIDGIGEILAGDDLVMLVGNAIEDEISTGDIVVVTSKIVSKAEGRSLRADSREDAITAETVRLVASKPHPGGVTRIVQNKLGLVLAAAGVDASNAPDGTILLLPEDPDASARALCSGLRRRFGFDLAVLITDTLGRPWRVGQTDMAIGAAGMAVTHDLRGTRDDFDKPMEATITAVADEIAGAANLVLGKTSRRPVAVVHGLGHLIRPIQEPGARTLIRSAEDDLFRLGSAEAHLEGFREGFAAGERSAVEASSIADGSDTP